MRQFTLIVAIALAGCRASPPPPQPTPAYQPPPPPQTRQEWCERAIRGASNPYLDVGVKLMLIERIRNEGCLGQPQQQRIQIN